MSAAGPLDNRQGGFSPGGAKKGINNEYNEFFRIFPNLSGVRFLKKLGLDANLASWDLKIRIPLRKHVYSLIPRSQLVNPGQNTSNLTFSEKFRVLKLRFLAVPRGPGGFRELRGAGRNHFHLSWYL